MFDIYIDGFQDWDTVKNMATLIEVPLVPEMYRGEPDLEVFKELVGKSELATASRGGEGIVIKAYGYHDSTGHPLYVKMVSEKFSEAKSAPKVISPEKVAEFEFCNSFAASYVTIARVYKLIEKLKERNIYTGQMQDMKNLIPLLWEDLEKEELDVIKQFYDKGISQKSLNGACTKLLGKIYGAIEIEDSEKIVVDTLKG